MADLWWGGSENDEFDEPLNWRTVAGAKAGAAPTNGDGVNFTRKAIWPCRINTNSAANNFTHLVVGQAYQHNLGEGSPLNCSADNVFIDTLGTVFLEEGTGVYDNIRVRSGNLVMKNHNNASSVWNVFGGRIELTGSNRTLGTLNFAPLPGLGIEARLRATITTLTVDGGLIYLFQEAAVTTCDINDGTVIHDGTTMTTVNQRGGVFFDHSRQVPTTINIWDGLYSFDGNQHADSTLTIGTINFYGGAVDLRSGHGNIAVTTFNILGEPLQLRLDAGRKIT